MTRAGKNDLWTFALEFYGRPGVEDACLALQDEEGLNVNLLLWCCFLAKHGHALTAETAGAAADRIEPWHGHVTVPLRAVRRAIKEAGEPGADAVHERLKEAELTAEKVELALLQDMSDGFAATSPPVGRRALQGLAIENLRAYLTWAGKNTIANPFLPVLANTLATGAENR